MSAAAHWSSSRDARPRFRLTAPPPPLEVDLQAACAQALDRLLLPPAFWFAMPVGHIELSAAQMARLTKIGLKRGLPDIWVLYNGVYCVELKRRGGSLSRTRVGRTRRGSPRIYEGQTDVFPRLLASGAIEDIAICNSVDDMLVQLARWQIPLRGGISI